MLLSATSRVNGFMHLDISHTTAASSWEKNESWPFSISPGKQVLSSRKRDGEKSVHMATARTALAAVTGSGDSPKELVWAEHVGSLK